MKEKIMGGSGISCTIFKSFAPCFIEITMLVPHYSVLKATCHSCHPINSVKVLRAICWTQYTYDGLLGYHVYSSHIYCNWQQNKWTTIEQCLSTFAINMFSVNMKEIWSVFASTLWQWFRRNLAWWLVLYWLRAFTGRMSTQRLGCS